MEPTNLDGSGDENGEQVDQRRLVIYLNTRSGATRVALVQAAISLDFHPGYTPDDAAVGWVPKLVTYADQLDDEDVELFKRLLARTLQSGS